MNMKSRFILLALCLATSGFNKFSKTPRSVFEIRMKNDFFGSTRDVESSQSIFLEAAEKTPDVPEPWTAKQLMAPADLAAIINAPNAKKPVIFCVGPGALVKGSLDMGPAKEKENLEKLKQQLNKLPRDTDVVIYCGCCPFEHCPNIRPAFNLLNEMKFSNAHLLNLEHNIKTDWVAKGYPQA
jgi:thiosulfate/3-mercaptopyruvate sulfurtransferase